MRTCLVDADTHGQAVLVLKASDTLKRHLLAYQVDAGKACFLHTPLTQVNMCLLMDTL